MPVFSASSPITIAISNLPLDLRVLSKVYHAISDYISGVENEMTQQIVLVTGASSGIGSATAQYLAEQGFYVFAAARRIDRLEALRTPAIEPLAMDVTSDEDVKRAIQHILSSKGRIDVLVNNAGYALYGAVEEVSLEDAAYQLNVNVLGLMRVTQAVLPIMRQQRTGIIVNLSSVAGKVSTPFAGWYAASKHAVEALSDALRLEVKRLGIRVVIIEPGSIKTEFGDIALRELHKASTIDDYVPMAASFDKLISNSFRNAPGPDIIAKAIHKAVISQGQHARYALPNDSRMFIFLRRLLSDRVFDALLGSQIRA
ncbi:MAG: oxidoreductase [bacterium]|nr:oxidoreductase [bacterium]